MVSACTSKSCINHPSSHVVKRCSPPIPAVPRAVAWVGTGPIALMREQKTCSSATIRVVQMMMMSKHDRWSICLPSSGPMDMAAKSGLGDIDEHLHRKQSESWHYRATKCGRYRGGVEGC